MYNSGNAWGYSWRNKNGSYNMDGNREPFIMEVNPYLSMICPHEGCGQMIDRKNLPNHSATCEYKPIPCPHCGVVMKSKEVKVHVNSCPRRPVKCPNNCKTRCGETLYVPFDQLGKHRKVCTLEVVNCSFSNRGCFVRGKREDILIHEQKEHKEELLIAIHKQTRNYGNSANDNRAALTKFRSIKRKSLK
jgi:TRAF-type zinc finger